MSKIITLLIEFLNRINKFIGKIIIFLSNFIKIDRLKEINETFEGNILLGNETSIKDYYLSTNIGYNNIFVNAFNFIGKDKKGKETTFRYISNINVNNDKIKNVIKLGRNRWKIENEGFYNQKHKIFNIAHLNSRNDTAMKNHYFFIQFAHTIRQLLEQGNLLTKSLKLKIKEVSRFLLDTLTSNHIRS